MMPPQYAPDIYIYIKVLRTNQYVKILIAYTTTFNFKIIIFFIYLFQDIMSRLGAGYDFKATFVALFPALSIAFKMFINMWGAVSI